MKFLPFQRTFLKAVENPSYDTVALSGPRSLGKTSIAAHVLTRCLTPGDELSQPGKEYILGAATIEQARMTFSFVRESLEGTREYRWIDSATRLGATHKETNTKLRVISSNAKSSFGLVNVPLVVLDEPGALELQGGQMLADSLFTAQGKVGSRLKLVLCGTLAPMATHAGHWWFDLVTTGTTGRKHVQYFRGDPDVAWDNWYNIARANPLAKLDAHTREVIKEEREEARSDSRLRARFMSYRLNIPSADEATTLLTVADWKGVLRRDVASREGRATVGVDLGGGRAWSAATAMWPSGRVECVAVAPGIPSLEAQERRDRVPRGTYQALVDIGSLHIADGIRVPEPKQLVEYITSTWGKPRLVVCDRFDLDKLKDASRGIRFEPRVRQWSEATEDVWAVRKLALDGPLSVDEHSELLLTASLSVSMVENDKSGNTRMVKRGFNNQARDDVAVALSLASGSIWRLLRRKPRFKYMGMA